MVECISEKIRSGQQKVEELDRTVGLENLRRMSYNAR